MHARTNRSYKYSTHTHMNIFLPQPSLQSGFHVKQVPRSLGQPLPHLSPQLGTIHRTFETPGVSSYHPLLQTNRNSRRHPSPCPVMERMGVTCMTLCSAKMADYYLIYLPGTQSKHISHTTNYNDAHAHM